MSFRHLAVLVTSWCTKMLHPSVCQSVFGVVLPPSQLFSGKGGSPSASHGTDILTIIPRGHGSSLKVSAVWWPPSPEFHPRPTCHLSSLHHEQPSPVSSWNCTKYPWIYFCVFLSVARCSLASWNTSIGSKSDLNNQMATHPRVCLCVWTCARVRSFMALCLRVHLKNIKGPLSPD